MSLGYNYNRSSRTYSTDIRLSQSNAVRCLDNLLAEVGYPTSYGSVALNVVSGQSYVFYGQGDVKELVVGTTSRLGQYSRGLILTKSTSDVLWSIIRELVKPARKRFKGFDFNWVVVGANGNIGVSHGGSVDSTGSLSWSYPKGFAVFYNVKD